MKPSTKLFTLVASVSIVFTACGIGTQNSASGGITEISTEYAFPPDDAEATLAFADEVAVVRLVGEGRASLLDQLPVTDFQAVVSSSLTGSFKPGEEIVVRQEGGTIEGETFLLEDQPLMKPGQTYVIAGRITEEGALYALPGVGTEGLGRGDVDGTAALEAWSKLGKPGNGTFVLPEDDS